MCVVFLGNWISIDCDRQCIEDEKTTKPTGKVCNEALLSSVNDSNRMQSEEIGKKTFQFCQRVLLGISTDICCQWVDRVNFWTAKSYINFIDNETTSWILNKFSLLQWGGSLWSEEKFHSRKIPSHSTQFSHCLSWDNWQIDLVREFKKHKKKRSRSEITGNPSIKRMSRKLSKHKNGMEIMTIFPLKDMIRIWIECDENTRKIYQVVVWHSKKIQQELLNYHLFACLVYLLMILWE